MTLLQVPTDLATRAARRHAHAMARPGPRVLMVVESAGGTGRHVLDLCEKGLINRGCEAHLIYSTGRIDSMFLERLRPAPPPHGGSDALHHRSVRLRRRADRLPVPEHGPFDAIHGHSSKGGAIARAGRARHGRARVLHAAWPDHDGPRAGGVEAGVYLSIEIGLGLRTTRIIAVSPEEQRAAIRLGLGRSRVALVPNGIGPWLAPARPGPRRDPCRTTRWSSDSSAGSSSKRCRRSSSAGSPRSTPAPDRAAGGRRLGPARGIPPRPRGLPGCGRPDPLARRAGRPRVPAGFDAFALQPQGGPALRHPRSDGGRPARGRDVVSRG